MMFTDHSLLHCDFPPSSYAAHSSPMTTGFPAAETHHPSLRRRKWAEKPGSSLAGSGVSGVSISHGVGIPHGVGISPGIGIPHGVGAVSERQSALEKSLSLQAELAQHRPLSMVVPFGALEPGNAIVNQVADSLLQQARYIYHQY